MKRLTHKEKFLKKQQRAYNTLKLELNELYPNISDIAKRMKQNQKDIDREIALIDDEISDFKLYNQDEKEIKSFFFKMGISTILFLILLIFSSTISVFLTVGIFIYGLSLIGNSVYGLLSYYPYAKTIIKSYLTGYNEEYLLSYRHDLKRFEFLNYLDRSNPNSLLNQLASKNKHIKEENKNLKKSVIRSRNMALWQTHAFTKEQFFFHQVLDNQNYVNFWVKQRKLQEELKNFYNASLEEKEQKGFNLDLIVQDIWQDEAQVEKEYTRIRK